MNIENLHSVLPERIPAEICDQIQFFLRSNADQQMRFVIFLSQQIDIEINRFLTLSIPPFDFPLVKARIIRNSSKDVFCINMNHTPTDGAGLKEFVKILSSNYNHLLENQDYVGLSNINGDRSIKQVTRSFTFLQKLQFIKRGFKQPRRFPLWSFDWNKSESDNESRFATIKISAETFTKIKAFGKNQNATINDIILAAFIRVFVSTNPKNEKAAKPVIVPVDLRKHIKLGHNTAICSLTGSLICSIGADTGITFADTLQKVKEEMTFKKKTDAEMNMLAPFLVLSKFMSYSQLKEKTMQRKMPPIPLVTNVGIINSSDINFNNIPVEYSYMTGAINFGAYFCMCCSTFNNEITFSIGFTGGDLQKQKISVFFDKLKTELESIN